MCHSNLGAPGDFTHKDAYKFALLYISEQIVNSGALIRVTMIHISTYTGVTMLYHPAECGLIELWWLLGNLKT